MTEAPKPSWYLGPRTDATPAASTLTINAAGLAIIETSEGLVLTATQDPTGVWTIGYGHTIGVVQGQQITVDQANALLAQDLAVFESGVGAVAVNPTSNQFSAMVSLAYNIGMGGFNGSTVLRDHNAGNFAGAADAFLMWDKAHVDGQLVVLPGLDVRRAAERALYLTPDSAPAPPPMPPPTEATISVALPTEGTDQSGNKVKLVWSSVAAGIVMLAGGLALSPKPDVAPIARPPLERGMEITIRHGFDFSGSTFTFDQNLRPVPIEKGR